MTIQGQLVNLPGGETIWYKTTGDGVPLLHIHGSAFGHRNFAHLTPLSARHAQVIDFDLPGYGESRGSPRPAVWPALPLWSPS